MIIMVHLVPTKNQIKKFLAINFLSMYFFFQERNSLNQNFNTLAYTLEYYATLKRRFIGIITDRIKRELQL